MWSFAPFDCAIVFGRVDVVRPSSAKVLVVSARLEEEAAVFETDEGQREYLSAFGLESTGLDKIITGTKRWENGFHIFRTCACVSCYILFIHPC